MAARPMMEPPVYSLPLEDCIGWGTTIARLKPQVDVLLSCLAKDIEALGDGNPYDSRGFFTPQGNSHAAYANGKVKIQGEPVHPVKCADFSEAAQLKAFEEVAEALLATIKDDKPQGRNRLIWRELPDASRELHEDGLYIKIYTRLGWDKSEGQS